MQDHFIHERSKVYNLSVEHLRHPRGSVPQTDLRDVSYFDWTKRIVLIFVYATKQGSWVCCQAQAGFAAFGKGVNLIGAPPPPTMKLIKIFISIEFYSKPVSINLCLPCTVKDFCSPLEWRKLKAMWLSISQKSTCFSHDSCGETSLI